MPSKVRMAAGARLAAALLAVPLTGATTRLPPHAQAGVHRCTCSERPGERHECDCALCRAAALMAQASDEKAPPCHRAAARKALVESAPTGSRDAPSFECICGEPAESEATPAGLGPFCSTADRAVTMGDRTEARQPSAGDPAREGPAEPETPPP